MTKSETVPQSLNYTSHHPLTLGPSVIPNSTNPQLWSLRPQPKYRRSSPQLSTKPSEGPTKAKATNHPNGGHMTEEEEEIPQEEEEVEEEEATQHQDPPGVHQAEETQFPPDQTYPLTSDPFPVPTIRG